MTVIHHDRPGALVFDDYSKAMAAHRDYGLLSDRECGSAIRLTAGTLVTIDAPTASLVTAIDLVAGEIPAGGGALVADHTVLDVIERLLHGTGYRRVATTFE